MVRDPWVDTSLLSQRRRARTPVGRKAYPSALEEEDDEHLRHRNDFQSDENDVTLQEYANLLEKQDSPENELAILRRDYRAWRTKRKDIDARRPPSPRSGDRPDQQEIGIMGFLNSQSQRAIRALGYGSSHARDQDKAHQTLGGPNRPGPDTFDRTIEPDVDAHQLLDGQRGLTTSILSCARDIESLATQSPTHPRNAYRVTVCHALIGTSIIGIATSLSLALWWSIAHGDPGSGFTIGSYVLAIFGVLVAIPGYPHSKACRCWDRKSKRGAKVL